MRTHLVALAAVLGLAMPASAGELDREFKGGDVKARATAPPASTEVARERVSGTELDDESPTQAWHRRGWGGGWGWGGGFRVGWGGGWGHGHRGWGGWGYGHRGWGGWGGYASWYRPYHGFHGGLSYWPSYYRPFYSSYAFSYPSWGYAAFAYPGWGNYYW